MVKNWITGILISLGVILVFVNLSFALQIDLTEFGWITISHVDTADRYVGFGQLIDGYTQFIDNNYVINSLKDGLTTIRNFMNLYTLDYTFQQVKGVSFYEYMKMVTDGSNLNSGTIPFLISFLYVYFNLGKVVVIFVFLLPVYSNLWVTYAWFIGYYLLSYVSYVVTGAYSGQIIEMYDYETGTYTGGVSSPIGRVLSSIKELKYSLPF